MLLRSANAVGYRNYPDNVVRYFVRQAAASGVDVFRVFDSLNWVANMRVAIDAVRESGKLCEAAICYTGNLSDPRESKYTLDYYVQLARELAAAGAHIIGIKDMAGLCRPAAVLRHGERDPGIDEARWPKVAQAYADVNDMFGDIVKVTPTSKVVGDMAIMMVTSGLTRAQVEDPAVQIAFPESVVQLMRGDIGQPFGGFPPALQAKVLNGAAPLTVRPGEVLPPVDLEATRSEVARKIGREVTDCQLASYLMYPRVFLDYARDRAAYGDMGRLPTPVFFYGMEPGQEISIDLERGKTLIVTYVAVSETHDDGTRTVFFELNGQPRSVRVADRSQVARRPPQRKVEPGNACHIGAPLPGSVATVAVAVGQKVTRGDVVVSLEAMKMETAVRTGKDGQVVEVLARPGLAVDAKDLLVVLG